MTPRDVTPAGSHDEVQLLLPGYVSKRLSHDEHAQVEAHLRYCSQCRADLKWDTLLAHAEPAPPAALDAERALQRAMRRLPAPPVLPAPGFIHTLCTRLRGTGWLPWAVALPAIMLSLTLLRPEPRAPHYRALSSAVARPDARLVVLFGPDTRIDQVGQILRRHGARIVDGPLDSGAYLVAVAPAQEAATAHDLKANAHVLLAESLSTARP